MSETPEKAMVVEDLIKAAGILEVAARLIAEDTNSDKVALNMARRAWDLAMPLCLQVLKSQTRSVVRNLAKELDK